MKAKLPRRSMDTSLVAHIDTLVIGIPIANCTIDSAMHQVIAMARGKASSSVVKSLISSEIVRVR